MKQFYMLVIVAIAYTSTANAQKGEFNQNFESLDAGKNITKLQKGKFVTWGKSTWTVTEEEGKGFNNSNKYASSGDEVGSTLVQYRNLEVGATYVFSVAVKMTNVGKQAWKGNYTVHISSGKKGDVHSYGKEKIIEPKANIWEKHELEFTVIEGRERVIFNVYRWAKDVILNADDFKLVKK